MAELKRHVETIVRPIRASIWRKNRMREELLEHLVTAAESERASGTSDELADERAIARLGRVELLRAELQAPIPSLERILAMPLPWITGHIDAWFEKEDGQSASRYGLIRAVRIGVSRWSPVLPGGQ